MRSLPLTAHCAHRRRGADCQRHALLGGATKPAEATRKFQVASGSFNPNATPALHRPPPQQVAANAQSAAQAEPADFARAPAANESAHWITRTALCVEVRDPRRASGPKAEAVGVKSRA